MAIELEVLDVPLETVLSRLARFEDLQYNPDRDPDNGREGNDKKIFTVVGPGLEVNNAGDSMPAIPIEEGFNITYVKVKPGNGPSLHVHDGNETFIPINGRWKIIFGTKEEHSLELGPLDSSPSRRSCPADSSTSPKAPPTRRTSSSPSSPAAAPRQCSSTPPSLITQTRS